MKRALLAWALALAAALPGASALAQPDRITVAYFLEWPTANQVAQVNDTYSEELGVPVEWRAFGNGNEMSQARPRATSTSPTAKGWWRCRTACRSSWSASPSATPRPTNAWCARTPASRRRTPGIPWKGKG